MGQRLDSVQGECQVVGDPVLHQPEALPEVGVLG